MSIFVFVKPINSASLRSYLRGASKWFPDRRNSLSIVDNDLTTAESVLSRRRPILPSNERRKRWSNDEILIDETIIEQTTGSALTSEKEETTNSATTDPSEEISLYNSTSAQITSEGTIYPLLRQDIVDNNQTEESSTIVANDDANNSTVLTTVSNEITTLGTTESSTISKIDQTQSNETSEATTDASNSATTQELTSKSLESETTTVVSINQITQEAESVPLVVLPTNLTTPLPTSELDTAIILLDFTTKFPPIATTYYENETLNETEITTASYYTMTISQDNLTETMILLNTTQNVTTANEYEIETTTTVFSDVTSTSIIEEDEYSNNTNEFLPVTEAKPICDLTCQCTKECPYGFQFINDTCKCDPPCKNYQCFGNDTCIVTGEGRPYCQVDNGTEHDRPERCYQPRDSGYHDVHIRYHNRWYYHPDQDTCHLFVYRGLGGNENNFQTLHECNLECITCAPAPDRGECLGRLPMWYYDHKKKQCSQFDYSGCKGNDNKFLRKRECIDTCLTRILGL
ncbi:unnamed protein product [Adineta ricciae]|uniref:BPTI/Kunitz inhibitor domain-containing protein n=1 Tax=Adineta ricciae TaxID=249248 RepID=A0A814NFD9_ADIRI|nr:unnamed protein product [Adineta ricciae]CAF1091252.1 unnamed protein product [Adineta ricciae]